MYPTLLAAEAGPAVPTRTPEPAFADARDPIRIDGDFFTDERAALREALLPAAQRARARLTPYPDHLASVFPAVLYLHTFKVGRRRFFFAQALTRRREIRRASSIEALIEQARALLDA